MAPRWRSTVTQSVLTAAFVLLPAAVAAQSKSSGQFAPGEHRSSNMKLVAHLPLPGERFSHADIELEQEISRPYVYVGRRKSEPGFDIISIKDPAKPKLIYSYVIEDAPLHRGSGGVGGHYAKVNGRYYFVEAWEFQQAGKNADLGASIFDVTGLPDPKTVKKVADIRYPDMPGGIHEIFTYKHSDGRVILATTSQSENGFLYDLGKLVKDGNAEAALLGKFVVPQTSANRKRGWHDMYLGYDPATKQDKLYGAGMGGYYVFDITSPEAPSLLFSITGVDGTPAGHTLSPTPDGKFLLGISEPTYQYAPVRSFDLRPALEGKTKNINRSIGAWIAKWNGASHYHEVRWPYVFISAQDDGVQVVNYMDPTNPYTVAYYSTREGPELGGESPGGMGWNGGGIYDGAWGVDVRNADGLIVSSDFNSGLWVMRMEGFDGWNGHDWGMPNISGAQDYDNGPDGAQRTPPKPVT